jgi:hypothetical protein
MRAMGAFLVALALTTVGASRALSSDEWSFEVIQPIWTDNDLSLSRVTVLTFNSGDVGVYAALATCDSNHVMNDPLGTPACLSFCCALGRIHCPPMQRSLPWGPHFNGALMREAQPGIRDIQKRDGNRIARQ